MYQSQLLAPVPGDFVFRRHFVAYYFSKEFFRVVFSFKNESHGSLQFSLQPDGLVATIGFDTTENGPSKVWGVGYICLCPLPFPRDHATMHRLGLDRRIGLDAVEMTNWLFTGSASYVHAGLILALHSSWRR